MTRAAAVAALLALAGPAAACGDDEGGDQAEGVRRYDVVLVVGAAVADEGADPAGFPGEGSTFEERWVLDCDGDGCTLGRPEGGALLGDLDGLALERSDEGDLRGRAEGVRPEPGPEGGECAGSAAESWTVEVELQEGDGTIVGSVFRIPDALVDGPCFGLDLTLGLSGASTG